MNDIQLSDNEKCNLLNSDTHRGDLLFAIRQSDLQAEAIDRVGRLLTADEVSKVSDALEWGIGEGMNLIYNAAFSEIVQNAK